MLIQQGPLLHWLTNFYGYGSWKSKCWFIGFEENGGDTPEEVAEKLNYFYKAHQQIAPTLADIRELYREVKFRVEGPRAEKFANFNDHRFGKKAALHGAWKNLIAFEFGYQHKKLPDLLAYQQKSFASSSKPREALIQLYPLPAHNHAWYYGWLDLPQFPFLKRRESYYDHLYPERIQTLLQNISTYQPEVVVMYGMEDISKLKKSIQDFFPKAKFKTFKAVKQQIPQHHRADFHGTTLLITTQLPSLRHNRIETGFDWYRFGKMIKDNEGILL